MNWLMWGNIIAPLIIAFIFVKRKRYKLTETDFKGLMKNNTFFTRKMGRFVNPFYIKDRAKEADWDLDFTKYTLIVLATAGIAMALFYTLFQLYTVIPFGLIVGLGMPNVFLFYKKRQQKNNLFKTISLYINSMASMTSTYQNIALALKETIPTMPQPMKRDLELVALRLENGDSVKAAYRDFNEKYQNSHLLVFHENLDVLNRYGGDIDDVLFSAASAYDNTLSNRQKIINAKTTKIRAFHVLLIYLIIMPFLLMFFSYEYYHMFASSIPGRIINALIIGLAVLSIIQMEREYDKEYLF